MFSIRFCYSSLVNIVNHLLAGSIIAISFKNPVFVLPLAFASHFAMDVLPHYGYAGKKGYVEALKHRMSYVSTIISVILCIIIGVVLIVNNRWLALGAGLLAMSIDFVGIWNYLAFEKYGRSGQNLLAKLHVGFHRRIQWCERPWGIYIEVVVFALLFWLLLTLL